MYAYIHVAVVFATRLCACACTLHNIRTLRQARICNLPSKRYTCSKYTQKQREIGLGCFNPQWLLFFLTAMRSLHEWRHTGIQVCVCVWNPYETERDNQMNKLTRTKLIVCMVFFSATMATTVAASNDDDGKIYECANYCSVSLTPATRTAEAHTLTHLQIFYDFAEWRRHIARAKNRPPYGMLFSVVIRARLAVSLSLSVCACDLRVYVRFCQFSPLSMVSAYDRGQRQTFSRSLSLCRDASHSHEKAHNTILIFECGKHWRSRQQWQCHFADYSTHIVVRHLLFFASTMRMELPFLDLILGKRERERESEMDATTETVRVSVRQDRILRAQSCRERYNDWQHSECEWDTWFRWQRSH